MPKPKPSKKSPPTQATPKASPLVRIAVGRLAWPAAQVTGRDELLDAIVRLFRRRPATRPMAKRVARHIDVFRGVEAEEGARMGIDSATRLVAIARDRAARIVTATGHEKASAHLDAKRDVLILTGTLRNLSNELPEVLSPRRLAEERRRIVNQALDACGMDVTRLEDQHLREALAARWPDGAALRLVFSFRGNQDGIEEFRRKLARVKLRPVD
jgi:hypothetical protein